MPASNREQWIEAAEAAAILTKNSGHPISTDYVRLLGNQGKVRHKLKNKRQKYYLRGDVEDYRVKAHRPHRRRDEEPEEEGKQDIA